MGGPWFSLRGVHELCIQRENDSIQFKRWSHSENCSKLWATLRFQTWEGMLVLFKALECYVFTGYLLQNGDIDLLLTHTLTELILMYCTFLALKSRNALTVQLATKEYALKGEHKLFQA